MTSTTLHCKRNWLLYGEPLLVGEYRTTIKSIRLVKTVSRKLSKLGSAVHVPSFWWRYCLRSYIEGYGIRKVLKFKPNLTRRFRENRHFILWPIWRSPDVAVGMLDSRDADLWRIPNTNKVRLITPALARRMYMYTYTETAYQTDCFQIKILPHVYYVYRD
jgi:hypothetical protein